jgi:hypothetical protein
MDEAAQNVNALPNPLQALLMTEAHGLARKAVKAQWQAQGRKVPWVDPRELAETTRAYLDAHRAELVNQARANLPQRSVRLVPQIRTLAEHMDRQRKANQR